MRAHPLKGAFRGWGARPEGCRPGRAECASGALAVVAGAVREHSVKAGRSGPPRLLTASRHAGQLRVFGEHHVHEIVNTSDQPAVSIHLCSPALTTMTRYRWTRRGPVVTSVERAGADW